MKTNLYILLLSNILQILLYKQKLLSDAKVGCAGNVVVTLSTAFWLYLISKVWTTELPVKQLK